MFIFTYYFLRKHITGVFFNYGSRIIYSNIFFESAHLVCPYLFLLLQSESLSSLALIIALTQFNKYFNFLPFGNKVGLSLLGP